MIMIVDNTIIQDGVIDPIKRWEVWYMTPMGITPSLDEAREMCTTHDLNPETCIIPRCVAIGALLYEVSS